MTELGRVNMITEAFLLLSHLVLLREWHLNVAVDIVGLHWVEIHLQIGLCALGHPLACTGTKLSVQLFNELRRRGKKYGIVSACVGGGQGVAGIYELLN